MHFVLSSHQFIPFLLPAADEIIDIVDGPKMLAVEQVGACCALLCTHQLCAMVCTHVMCAALRPAQAQRPARLRGVA